MYKKAAGIIVSGPDCRKRCAHPLAPSARGLRPQAVGERTVRLSEIFRALARFSPSAPSGHLPRRGRFFDALSRWHNCQRPFYTGFKPSPLGGKVAPQGRMRGKFTGITRLQAISARLPLISQWSGPLTASLTSPPPVSALPPAYRSPAVHPSASGSAHCSRRCGPHQGGRPAAGGQRGA